MACSWLRTCAALAFAACAAVQSAQASPRVEELLSRMTLEEKVGQLNLVSGNHAVTGPFAPQSVRDAILKGQAGGLFNVYGAEYTRSLQAMALTETRLGIPLLLGFDVLHGYRTILPIPLGQAASWDMEAIQAGERVSATEASAAGVNWIFAPMVDVTRDPRWGRVAEGSGESAWLGAQIAAARVHGLEGRSLSAPELRGVVRQALRRQRRDRGGPRLQRPRSVGAGPAGAAAAALQGRRRRRRALRDGRVQRRGRHAGRRQ